MSSEENCSFLYLPAPAGLTRDESYLYHLTTRNFFAWLLGVPLVGTDPVSALLDLKVRMDMWRDPGSGNFGALFDYVKEQGYGDFEALEIEMGKRLNADMHQAPGTLGFPPTNPTTFNDQSRPVDEGKTSRRNSLTQRIKRKLSRSRVRGEERPAPTSLGQESVEARFQTLRMNSYSFGPSPPSVDRMSPTMQSLVSPASTQSVNAVPNLENGKEEKMNKRRSWTNLAGNAWKRKSMTDIRLTPLQTRQLQPVGAPEMGGTYMSPPVSAQAFLSEPSSATAEKRKHRLSRKRASMTEVKMPALQTQLPSALAPALADSPQSAPVSASVPAEGKKKRRLSWANVSDKIFDIMMPPISKDDLPPAEPHLPEGVPPSTSEPSDLPATEVAAAAAAAASASSSAAVGRPATETKPNVSPSAGGSATRPGSRHPSIHDFSTGKEICACCGKVRQSRAQSDAGPSQPTPTGLEVVKDVADTKDAFQTLHGHTKARRKLFKSRSHREIIIPNYGNGIRGQASDAGNRGARSTDAPTSPAGVQSTTKGQETDARKLKTRSIDVIASPIEARTSMVRKPKTPLIGSTMSIDAIVAPTQARTKELKKLHKKPTSGVVSSMKVQPETSVGVPVGPMSAAELVPSPTSLEKSSATSSSSPGPLSRRDYQRSSWPGGLDHGQPTSGASRSGVFKTDRARDVTNVADDVRSHETNAGKPGPSHPRGSTGAQPETDIFSEERGVEEDKFQVVDEEFELNIEDLLTQLEEAGIGDTKTEKGKEKQKSLVDLEPRLAMPRLVYEVA